ncbi:unnamed protein product, partial [Staurois parvus]
MSCQSATVWGMLLLRWCHESCSIGFRSSEHGGHSIIS